MRTKDIQMNRYDRQIAFQGVGLEGQSQISRFKVLVIGCGALGNVISDCLVRSGIGFLRILDDDIVDLSNLQRQILFTMDDIGKHKVQCAGERLSQINPEIRLEMIRDRLQEDSAERFFDQMDIVVDATDSFSTSLLLNRLCVRQGIPLVFGGIAGSFGNLMTIIPKGPCLACFASDDCEIPTARQQGMLGPLVLSAGSIMASEVLKLAVGHPVNTQWFCMDLWKGSFRYYEVPINPHCEVCSALGAH